MKKILSLLLSVILILSLAIPLTTAFAEESATSKVEYYISEDADGIVEVDLTVQDARILAFQTAVRYNTEVLTPIDSSNNPTEDFEEFIVRTDNIKPFQEIGMNLDAEKGLFGFTFFVMPGTRGEAINKNYEFVADSNGTEFCTFRFKRIAEGDYGFEVALKDDEKPYQAALPEGLIMTNYDNSAEVQVSFEIEGKAPEETVITPEKPAITTPEPEKGTEKPAETTPEPDDQEKVTAEPGEEVQLFTSVERKQDVICLKIGSNMTITYGKKKVIDDENPLVVPYITEDRTLVPLRYIAETLGAEVLWEEGWDGCIIKKDNKEIEITFGSAEFSVNGEKVVYDAPIEVVENRTMVPVRFISEELGCDVYWNELNYAVVISPIDNPWVEDRDAEITALNEMLISIIGLL